MTRASRSILPCCAALLLAAGALSCNSKTSGGGSACGDGPACEGGAVCSSGVCKTVCGTDAHCAATEICLQDLCETGARTDKPVITAIDANGGDDTTIGHVEHHYAGELVIDGEHLQGSSVMVSTPTQSWSLEVCSSEDTRLIATLPSDFPSVDGTYTLTVANQLGSCGATLPILKGDKGDIGAKGDKGDTGLQGNAGAPGVPCAGCVDTATLADSAVTSAKIVDSTVALADLGMTCGTGQTVRRNAAGVWECTGGERCLSVTISNRVDGATWKYGRFDLPFNCYPPHMSTGYPTTPPTTFGCTFEMWAEHHSSNSAGVWKGFRGADMTIWPNADGSGHSYMEFWDYGAANVYDLQTGPGEIMFSPHWHDTCRLTDSYYNGTAWVQASPGGGGWTNLGLMANVYTRCTIRICEKRADPGTYITAERMAGPTTD